jgi:hypothetical protein
MPKSFEDLFEEQSLRALYRKMQKTARARFNCAHRLRNKHTFTLWSMSFFSAGLIVLSALSTYGIHLAVDGSAYSFAQFILALSILVISLLLSSGNYSDRAEKMHRCGMELNALCHSILPACKANSDQTLYERTLARYSDILAAYENHEDIDFALVKLEFPEDYPQKRFGVFFTHLKYWSGFWIHGVMFLTLVFIFWYVLF